MLLMTESRPESSGRTLGWFPLLTPSGKPGSYQLAGCREGLRFAGFGHNLAPAMKILFVVGDVFLSEPLGVLQLAAICRQQGHLPRLVALKRHDLVQTLEEDPPDVIAYSTMTADANRFVEEDQRVRKWMESSGRKVARIMGGPHPTYYPEVLATCSLDAICRGEGDRAMVTILDRLQRRGDLDGIPNVLPLSRAGQPLAYRELIADLDTLPSLDREILYEAVPSYRWTRMRSFLTSRGCPYDCSYCHNHAFNELFRGCGRIFRRRSVDSVIGEILSVVRSTPHLRLIRFGDDTFAHNADDWLREFLGEYRRKVGIPFYCLMRSNTLTDEMARLLSEAGCHSVGMSVETGTERVRRDILNRPLSDEVVYRSFAVARKYGIATWGNTMFGIPGTTLQDDYESFLFTRKLRLTCPTFGIFCPYPGTKLADYAVEKGLLQKEYQFSPKYSSTTPLTGYTTEEKGMQRRMALLAPLFCELPDALLRFLKPLARLRLTPLYSLLGNLCIFCRASQVFPKIYPANPFRALRIILDSFTFFAAERETQTETTAPSD
jgi:anaerobic magnesium-protoporphyrin IX monomethyl ester cyclase